MASAAEMLPSQRLARDLADAFAAGLKAAEVAPEGGYDCLDYVVLPAGEGWPGTVAPYEDRTERAARDAGFFVGVQPTSYRLTLLELRGARLAAACEAAAAMLRSRGWGAFWRRCRD